MLAVSKQKTVIGTAHRLVGPMALLHPRSPKTNTLAQLHSDKLDDEQREALQIMMDSLHPSLEDSNGEFEDSDGEFEDSDGKPEESDEELDGPVSDTFGDGDVQDSDGEGWSAE
ncbi:hypothetical protein MMC22_001543 [Lobaria immixta]|nr:hypothetical protein [Lobaria immixta]